MSPRDPNSATPSPLRLVQSILHVPARPKLSNSLSTPACPEHTPCPRETQTQQLPLHSGLSRAYSMAPRDPNSATPSPLRLVQSILHVPARPKLSNSLSTP